MAESEKPETLSEQIVRLKKEHKGLIAIEEADGILTGEVAQARLASVPGIGEVTALKLMAELGNVEGRSVKQVVAHSGLSPRERTSGISVRGRSRISKIGNHRLRTALYFPAMVACRFNPVIKAFYEKLVVAGKPKKVALIAVMRKLLQSPTASLRTKPSLIQNCI